MRRLLIASALVLAAATSADARATRAVVQFGFPLAARDAGNSRLGVDAGASIETMPAAYYGFGLDLIYHYWPTSPDYRAAFDRYLSSTRFQVLDSSDWAFGALQVTPHLRLLAPEYARIRPWIELGGGLYWVDRNISDPNWDGAVISVRGVDWHDTVMLPGWTSSAGFDVRIGARTALGTDATFHEVGRQNATGAWGDPVSLRPFRVWTVGTHVIFEW